MGNPSSLLDSIEPRGSHPGRHPAVGGDSPELGQETSIRHSALDSALILLYSPPYMSPTLAVFLRARLTRQMPVWRSGPAA